MSKNKKTPKIIAIGGGKGGVGKSLISSGISTALALNGKSTVCIDLDLGGANLHTFFGLRTTQVGIGDFLYKPHSKNLADYATEVGIENLKLISGSGFIPGIANLYYFQKLKILKAIKKLDFDYVVLDLGAGTNYNVIDFFSLTRSGIIVTNPEPTAILNAYEFIKNVLFRIFSRNFKQGDIALEVIEAHKFGQNQEQGTSVRDLIENLEQVSKEAALKVSRICKEFSPFLVLNMVKSPEHSKALAANLIDICKNFLNIKLQYLGSIPTDNNVSKALIKLNNLLLTNPETKASKAITKLTSNCLKGFKTIKLPDEALGMPETKGNRKREESIELSSMIERFFSEFKKTQGFEIDFNELSPLEILEPQLLLKPEVVTPIFIKDLEKTPENLNVPKNLKEILAFIVELGDIEHELKAKGIVKDLDIDLKEVATAWFKTGSILAKSGQYSTALKSYKKGLNIIPTNWQALNNIASCLILLGQIQQAKSHLATASELTKDFRIKYNMALIEFFEGNYLKCLELIDKAGKKSQLQEKVKNLKAYSLYYLEEYSKCLTTFEDVIGEEKELNCGLVNIITEDYTRAICHLKNYISSNKTNHDALALLSIAFFEKNQKQEAISTLEKAISLNPSDIKLRALNAYFSFKEGFLDKALKEAEIITKLRPANLNLAHFVSEIKELLNK